MTSVLNAGEQSPAFFIINGMKIMKTGNIIVEKLPYRVEYDCHTYDASQDPNGEILKSFLNDLSRPFGHEFVLLSCYRESGVGEFMDTVDLIIME